MGYTYYSNNEYNSKLVVPAATSLVPVAEFRIQLNLGSDDSLDDELNQFLLAAQDTAGNTIGDSIAPNEYQVSYSFFEDRLSLPHATIQSLDSVAYYAEGDTTTTTVDSSVYFLDTTGDTPAVVKNANQNFPSDASRLHEFPVVIDYTAGYDHVTSMPRAMAQAILVIAADMYKNRESVSDTRNYPVPFAAQRLLRPFRRY